jgi:hypothetical protein
MGQTDCGAKIPFRLFSATSAFKVLNSCFLGIFSHLVATGTTRFASSLNKTTTDVKTCQQLFTMFNAN